jgi:RAB protein geranylgeranyltransferase component A
LFICFSKIKEEWERDKKSGSKISVREKLLIDVPPTVYFQYLSMVKILQTIHFYNFIHLALFRFRGERLQTF